METLVVENSYLPSGKLIENLPPGILKRVKERMMSAEEWIETHGSGTLRKNKRIGFAWKQHYMEERIAYEFGYPFEMAPRSRITFGDAISGGDEKAITEAGWHIERYMTLSVFSEDYFECKYIVFAETEEKTREGIGIVVRQTSFAIPSGNIIFAIVAPFNKFTGTFTQTRSL